MLMLCVRQDALAQLNEHCTVSVLNRNVRVNPDGSWVLPNVPANLGQVRARATCVENGVTTSGESWHEVTGGGTSPDESSRRSTCWAISGPVTTGASGSRWLRRLSSHHEMFRLIRTCWGSRSATGA